MGGQGKKQFPSGYILKMELTGFANHLAVEFFFKERGMNHGCLHSLYLEPWRGGDVFRTAEKTWRPSLPAWYPVLYLAHKRMVLPALSKLDMAMG